MSLMALLAFGVSGLPPIASELARRTSEYRVRLAVEKTTEGQVRRWAESR
jgi:hypothetical protein